MSMISIFIRLGIVAVALSFPLPALTDGPTDTRGISAKVTGTIPLTGVFESSDGLMMRAREVTIAVGGRIAVHQHTGRPAIAYVLEGEVTEHRLSEGTKVIAPAGTTMTEQAGLTHWIENSGTVPARAIVVDIVPEK